MTFPAPDQYQTRHILEGDRFMPVRRRWGIAKNSRSNYTHSYAGPTWRAAGLIPPAQDSFFTTLQAAEMWAKVLTWYNAVGFHTFEFTTYERGKR